MTKMEEQVSKTFNSAEEARKFLEQKFQKQLHQIERKYEIQLGEKDQEAQRKYEKWLNKFHEMDSMSNNAKGKWQKERKELKKQV